MATRKGGGGGKAGGSKKGFSGTGRAGRGSKNTGAGGAKKNGPPRNGGAVRRPSGERPRGPSKGAGSFGGKRKAGRYEDGSPVKSRQSLDKPVGLGGAKAGVQKYVRGRQPSYTDSLIASGQMTDPLGRGGKPTLRRGVRSGVTVRKPMRRIRDR